MQALILNGLYQVKRFHIKKGELPLCTTSHQLKTYTLFILDLIDVTYVQILV